MITYRGVTTWFIRNLSNKNGELTNRNEMTNNGGLTKNNWFSWGHNGIHKVVPEFLD